MCQTAYFGKCHRKWRLRRQLIKRRSRRRRRRHPSQVQLTPIKHPPHWPLTSQISTLKLSVRVQFQTHSFCFENSPHAYVPNALLLSSYFINSLSWDIAEQCLEGGYNNRLLLFPFCRILPFRLLCGLRLSILQVIFSLCASLDTSYHLSLYFQIRWHLRTLVYKSGHR